MQESPMPFRQILIPRNDFAEISQDFAKYFSYFPYIFVNNYTKVQNPLLNYVKILDQDLKSIS